MSDAIAELAKKRIELRKQLKADRSRWFEMFLDNPFIINELYQGELDDFMNELKQRLSMGGIPASFAEDWNDLSMDVYNDL